MAKDNGDKKLKKLRYVRLSQAGVVSLDAGNQNAMLMIVVNYLHACCKRQTQ